MRRVRAAASALRGALGEPHATPARDEVLYVLSGSGTATIGGESRELRRRVRRPTSPPGTTGRSTTPTSSSCCPCSSSEPLPANGTTHAVVELAAEQTQRRDVRTPVPAARDARGRLRVGDAVRRLHPGRPGARPLPQIRRGRLRARRRGRAAHRRRVGAAPARLVRPPACSARALPRERRARRDAACSASSVLRALPRRRITPTARRPACPPSRRIEMPKIERTADIAWDGNLARGAGTISAETGAFSGARVLARDAHRRSRRGRRAPRSCSPRRTAAA